MITYVNNSNAGQYRVLYEKATRDLMAHNELNQLITPEDLQNSTDPSKKPLIEPTPVTAEELTQGDTIYEPNKYYRWDDEKKKYITAEESSPIEGVTYYKADDITSLNQYFGYIADLANINPLYTVLPLDEDVFTVDLNTRKIEIPQHFKENGISVQGDEIAEVVYFKVNRYFDAQDLAYYINGDDSYDPTNEDRDKMRIYIQWRSAQTGEDGKLIEGISVPWVVDITTYPDYILFGWPISSKVTGKDGTIDFAIRFFKFQDRKVTYSLSTLTHSVAVKPSLDFDISEKIADILDGTENSSLVLDDNTSMIFGRLANSEVTDEGVAAGEPYFFVVSNDGPDGTPLVTKVDSTVGNGTGIIDGGIQTSEGLVEEFWLGRDNETQILDKDILFKVSGSGDGRISYSWRKLNIDNKSLENVSFTNSFFETEDTEAQPGKTYYIKSGENAWSLAPTPVIFDENDPDYQTLYEYYSVATIDGVGYYYVTIKNRVQNSLAQKESIEMVVARPLAPQNNVPVVSTGLLKADEDYDLLLETDAEALDKGILTYQWYYSKNGGGILNADPIEGATESSYLIDGTDYSDENGADGDGYYYVTITNNMNKEIITIDGNENGTRVTHEATAPIVDLALGQIDTYNMSDVAAVGGLKIKFEVPAAAGENRQPDDSYSYQWYIYQPGEGDTANADREAAKRHEYFFDNDIPLEGAGANTDTFMPNLAGYLYYCEVTNTYNGSEAKGCSPFFYVTN